MNHWVIPTPDQILRCQMVQETRCTVMVNTGIEPKIMYASQQFLGAFNYEIQTVVEVHGVRMFLDPKLKGISCYFRKND